MHKLAGLRRGDTIVLSKENLPGAVLFPAMVCEPVAGNASSSAPATAAAAAPVAPVAPVTGTESAVSSTEDMTHSKSESSAATTADVTTSNTVPVTTEISTTDQLANAPAGVGPVTSVSTTTAAPAADVLMEHRFLAVTRERFLVLDSNGKGVGNVAVVKSNNHLTEVSIAIFL